MCAAFELTAEHDELPELQEPPAAAMEFAGDMELDAHDDHHEDNQADIDDEADNILHRLQHDKQDSDVEEDEDEDIFVDAEEGGAAEQETDDHGSPRAPNDGNEGAACEEEDLFGRWWDAPLFPDSPTSIIAYYVAVFAAMVRHRWSIVETTTVLQLLQLCLPIGSHCARSFHMFMSRFQDVMGNTAGSKRIFICDECHERVDQGAVRCTRGHPVDDSSYFLSLDIEGELRTRMQDPDYRKLLSYGTRKPPQEGLVCDILDAGFYRCMPLRATPQEGALHGCDNIQQRLLHDEFYLHLLLL